MNEEVVTVMVHSPKRGRRKNGKHTLPKNETVKEDQQHQKRNGKPSRRWLASEVERIFERNVELMRQLELKNEIERSLIDSKTKLERELALLKSRRVVGTHENEAIRERNKQLSQDVFLMQNILVKLNFELERYQEKLRKYEDGISKPEREFDGPRQSAQERKWINGEITIFAPLLLAYEESLKEKDDLIKDLRGSIERLSGKMKEIVKENSELRTKMADSEKQGEVTYSDWLGVQRELSITVEQNQLLTRQAKLAQSKISDLKAVFQTKLTEVCGERDDAKSKLSELRSEYLMLRGRNSALEQEFERLKDDASNRIPKSVHSAYIAECKRLLDELKLRHEEERMGLMRKIATLESEATLCQQKVPPSSPSNEIKNLKAKLLECEERCAKAERRRDFLKSRLDGLVNFSKELIAEHESLLKGVNGELRVNAGLSARIDQIKQQLKGVELETLQQIKILDENISTQVERVNKVRQEQNQEVIKLKEELQLKIAEIRELKEAGRRREEDMEIVWRAALSDKGERSHEEISLEFRSSPSKNK